MSRAPDFIWVLFVLFAVVASMLNKAKQARGGKGQMPPRRPGGPAAANQARRAMQEEIRRRLAERRIGGDPFVEEPPAEAESDLPPLLRQDERKERPAPAVAETARASSADAAAGELDRQRALEAKFHELRDARRAAEREAGSISHSGVEMQEGPGVQAVARMDFRAAVRADLRDPLRARRAVALREILGPPVGLR